MAQRDTGLHRLLASPHIFEAFQRAVGATRCRRIFVQEYVQPRQGDVVLDVGCGVGGLLPHLSQVDYLGFDLSTEYVIEARRRYGERGQFFVGGVESVALRAERRFDIVIAYAILHHLDDAGAGRLFELARGHLRPGGRLLTIDPCYVDGQSRAAHFVISQDRGRYVRTPCAYTRLAEAAFPAPRVSVRHDVLRIPYSGCILEMVSD